MAGTPGTGEADEPAVIRPAESRRWSAAPGYPRRYPGGHRVPWPRAAGAGAGRGTGGGGDIGWREFWGMGFAGGMGVERFGAGDGKRVDACYEIYRTERSWELPAAQVAQS